MTMLNSEHSLAGISLCEGMDAQAIEDISKQCDWRVYPSGAHIIDKTSDSREVFFITRGTVRVVEYSESGKEIVLDDLDAGCFFGELACIDGQPRSTNVVAIYPTTVGIMKQEVFFRTLNHYPSFNLRLLQQLTHLVRNSINRIIDLSTLSVQSRVYGELLRLAAKRVQPDGSGRISPIPVHSELANRISTTRETVARVLSELNRKGLVVKEQNVLVIKNIAELEALFHE